MFTTFKQLFHTTMVPVSFDTELEKEWSRLLSQACSQDERDEINDMFSGQIAA
jgi:hypothetical protein